MGQRAGKAAYWAAKEAGAAAQKTAKQMQEGAKQVHKGWTEASQNDRNKRNSRTDDRDK